MISNFEFLKQNELFNDFSDACIQAENGLGINTITCVILTRRALELSVKWVYSNDEELNIPYQDNLSALVHDISFRNIVDEKILKQLEYVLKLGSYALTNNKKVRRDEAILALRYLYNFTQWIAYNYTDNYIEQDFNESILPQTTINTLPSKERKTLYDELESKDKKLEEIRKEHAKQREELTKKRKNRKINYNFNIWNLSEKETRRHYIDLELQLAGWDFDKDIEIEMPVEGMPNSLNEGFVDYVLKGNNGLPLAVVEAKKTSVDPHVGQNQAKLYADCIEKEFKRRPIIFYTNGFEIYMWDDTEYPPRRVFGYYTKDELELLISRRQSKENLDTANINMNIAGRTYQIEAVKSICEAFQRKHRKALLVMATGTGKTRTAISIAEVLSQTNWAKNILFLADRTVLVKQAKNNFTKLLPDISCCNLLEYDKSKEDPETSRIIFSTYQTMINAIDTMNTKDGNRLFTPGHFDLIIIDEAHRSIYNKYQAIFDYFDGLLVGLTATPRNDIDKNTYRFFELENNVPTYMYEYEQAVKDGYLVDYHTIKTSTNFMDRGIKYSELSEKEKEEYENTFSETDEESMPTEIAPSAITTWLFNEDTTKKLLESLMEKGLKIEGGDKLGKTIIFAKNHKHAQNIVDIFNKMYPHYKGQFAKVIDNQVKYADSLIDDFSDPNKMPQIAVSVDMLDTGVDVPEILNLVFYKPVKSKIKFWQMIGRGTRLCKDIFGPGQEKNQFYIFDYCKNFEFFETQTKEIDSGDAISLTERILGYKLDLIVELQHFKYQTEEFIKYRNDLIDEFINKIGQINRDSFIAKMKVEFIDKFGQRKAWDFIDTIDKQDIKEQIIPLIEPSEDEENAKRFDNLLYQLQVKKIRQENFGKTENLIKSVVGQLESLGTIPSVVEKRDLIEKVAGSDYLDRANFWQVEEIRKDLRDLIILIKGTDKKKVYTDFVDTMDEIKEDDATLYPSNPSGNYKKKLEKYLNDNLENLVIYKIRHNQKLTELDKESLEHILFEELGTNSDFTQAYGDKNIIKVVRNIVGLDTETARNIFAKYINDNRLNTKQIRFVKLIIDYVIKNGTISLQVLTEDPFSSLGAVSEVFEDNIGAFKEIREDIEEINRNAEMYA